jgi:hypothetical protein
MAARRPSRQAADSSMKISAAGPPAGCLKPPIKIEFSFVKPILLAPRSHLFIFIAAENRNRTGCIIFDSGCTNPRKSCPAGR